MSLGLTQPLPEMSTRKMFWGVKAAGAYYLKTVGTYHVPTVLRYGSLNILEPSGPAHGLLHLFSYHLSCY